MKTTDWINVVYILIVIIVFIIQHNQIKKQNSILNYYDKIFSIIKIDEIEKYVKLKEDNIKLEYDNKTKTVDSFLERSEMMQNNAEKMIDDLTKFTNEKEIIIKIIELNKNELTDSYKILFDELDKIGNEDLKNSITEKLNSNLTKFDIDRREIMSQLYD